MTKHILACCFLVVRLGAQPSAKSAGAMEFSEAPSEMRAAIERYTADRGNLLRYYTIELSSERTDRLKKFYHEWLDRLPALNFEAMSQDGKVDYVVFRNHVQHELRQLDLDAKHQADAGPLVPFSAVIIDVERSRRRMEPVDPKKAAETLNGLGKQVTAQQRSVQASLRSSPPNKTVANRAATEVASLRAVLRRWFDFYNAYDPLFTWWAGESFKATDTALQNYAVFLREQVAGVRGGGADLAGAGGGRRFGAGTGPGGPGTAGAGQRPTTEAPPATAQGGSPARPTDRMDSTDDIIGDPIGREGLMSELASEMIPYTPEELIAIANKEFAWCDAEMKRASRELGFGDDWKKALEHVKNMYVEPGKQPQLIRDLEREAEAFLDQHDLITIPPLARETWRMEMMTPERQLVNPFFTGGETISVSYPVDSMTYEQKLMSMRGNNIPFSRATVFHELIPGHELQGYMAARYHAYRNLFSTPFLGEGWSLYWEMLLWDMKFQKTPADRVGALFWRMHRCARIIFSLSFHLGKMTPQECVDFLVDRVGHERANAIGEVRRSFNGTYSPLYQAAYLLGGMQIYAMHKELVDSGKMTNRQFHDAILKEGRMPVEMIRANLTKQKLERDFTSNWKFYGPVVPGSAGVPPAPAPDAGKMPALPGKLMADYVSTNVGPVPASMGLDPFYKKYTDALGIPVVSSEKPPDTALLVARDIVIHMLAKRPDVREAMIARKARVMIMAQTEMTTDVPEQRSWKKPPPPANMPEERRAAYEKLTDKEYWDNRARGMGGLLSSGAEENLLGYPGTKYFGENIFVHEFSHAILGNGVRTADPKLFEEVREAYTAAMAKGLWKRHYAATSVQEYWAEGTQTWFWSNYGFKDGDKYIISPDDLKEYDPKLYELLSRVYPDHHIPMDAYYAKDIHPTGRVPGNPP